MRFPLCALLLLSLMHSPFVRSDDYPAFSQFAQQSFGAERDALIYAHFGETLQAPGEIWEHLSERSVSIGFRSNLPARSYIEYGTDTSYGSRTAESDRHYAVHLHRLAGLAPGQTYRYRIVLQDERGNIVRSESRSLSPQTVQGAIRIPDQMAGGPPFLLNTAGARYVLTADIIAPGKAFEIAADGVQLDLGGHTVTYNNAAQTISGDWPTYVAQAAYGVRIMGYRQNVSIVNGRIRQGEGQNAAHAGASIGFNPVYARTGSGFEVAGVEFDYRGAQLVGLFMHWGSQDAHIHHNVFVDRGSTILNRHGSGARALIFYGADYPDSHIHDNLIKRTRQGGVQGNRVHHNEIYVDSYSINSFAIGRGDAAQVSNNRLFGTGYHVIGIAWGKANHYVGNFVHLVGQGPNHRDQEYGNQESLNGFRLTQYEGAAADYSDNLYERNLILIQGGACIDGSCTEARGIQHSSDANIRGNLIRENTVKVEMAANITQAAAIVTQGLRSRCGTEAPVRWEDNLLISNVVNVRMGDYYAAGCNHRMYRNRHVRVGQRPDYRSLQFDVGWALLDHQLIDPRFEGGASLDSLGFRHAGQELHVGWTAMVRVVAGSARIAGATVRAYEADGGLVAQGVTNGLGEVDLVVPERTRRQQGDTWRTPTRFTAELKGFSSERVLDIHAPTRVEIHLPGLDDRLFANGFEGG